MRWREQRGGALPAAILLQLVLLLVGLQIAMAAMVMRLAVARTGAMVRAERLAEAGVALASAQGSSRLAELLLTGESIQLTAMASAQVIAPPSVRILDDQDGDGDSRRDSNGRVLLAAAAEVRPFPATAASRASLVREALVGGWLPLPAALVDCAGALSACGGDGGCPVPAARITGGSEAAVAVPETLAGSLRRKLFILAREVLRGSLARCPGTAACAVADDSLLRAAATGVLRRLADPGADALALSGQEVALLVGNLLLLAGDEAGPGSIVWWDGGGRAVAQMADLVAVVESLARADGHVPTLATHPYPAVLTGSAEWSQAGDLCRRLAPLLEAAMTVASPGPAAGPLPVDAGPVTVFSAPRQVAAGETLAGEGLLILSAPVTVMAGGRLQWRGSVIVAGGAVAGDGQVVIEGSLLLAPATDSPLDLARGGLMVTRAADLHRQAWDAAGTVPLSFWFGPQEP